MKQANASRLALDYFCLMEENRIKIIISVMLNIACNHYVQPCAMIFRQLSSPLLWKHYYKSHSEEQRIGGKGVFLS